MLPSRRVSSLSLLTKQCQTPFDLGRRIEAHCHNVSTTEEEYVAHILNAAFNIRNNPRLGENVVFLSDSEMAEGTPLGAIEADRAAREARFAKMLQEKYDELEDREFQSIVHCRKCGSDNVSWEEKQTRSADEGATVFCVCMKCKTRWVVR